MSNRTKRTQTTEGQYVPPAYRRASRRGGSGGRRELVVASLFRGHGRRRCRRAQVVPYIRMSGAWLRRLGFERGDRIEVVAESGRLVLTIVHDERELPVN